MRKLINLFLREIISFSLSLFFRQWIVSGKSWIPSQGPIIFAGNHQNALLDSLIITGSSRKLPYYLARASVFKGKLSKTLLSFLRIMPIYRFRDGIGSVRKNEQIIGDCVSLLHKQEMLTLFPEGNHNDQWRIRPLQRGLARIAFQSEVQKEWKLGLSVIPVGIQYEEPRSFRSRIIVNFGPPMLVSDYREYYEKDARKGIDLFKEDLKKQMEKLVLHIPEERYENIYGDFLRLRSYRKKFDDQFDQDQRLVNDLIQNKDPVHHPSENQRSYNPLKYLFSLWVLINNIIPYVIIKGLVKMIVEDPVFTATLKFVLGLVILPIFYILIGITIGSLTGMWGLAAGYILIQPVIGYFGGYDLLIPLFRKDIKKGA